MSTSSLPKKLQMKAGQRVIVLNAPAGYLEKLVPLPEGVEPVTSGEGKFDLVLLFVQDLARLQELLPQAVQSVKYDALLWIAYPKGGTKAGTDLNRDRLWSAVAEHQFTGVTLIALDEVWSVMRFRPSACVPSTRNEA